MSDTESQAILAAQEATIRRQAEMIEELRTQFADLSMRVPAAAPAPLAPGQFLEFPRVVYRYHGGKPGQIDHPEHDAKTVATPRDLEDAIADGFSLTLDVPKDETPKGKRK
jgi:hypothetical protein